MKNHILCGLLSLILCAIAQAGGPRPDVGDGRVSWFDLTTTDMQRSKDFYGSLFGWTFPAATSSEHVAEIVACNKPMGSIRVRRDAAPTTGGVVYIQVRDMRASCKRAIELGGKIPDGFPFNLSDDRGAIALVVDPTGQQIGMYSRTPVPEAR